MIKVAVIDAHHLVRQMISFYLSTVIDFRIVIEEDNGEILIDKLKTIKVDVLLLAVVLPKMSGHKTAKTVRENFPNVKMIMLAEAGTKECIHKAMEVGVNGYFTKQGSLLELTAALKAVHADGFYFENRLGSLIHEAIVWDKNKLDPCSLAQLTERDIKMIKLVARGFDNFEIAEKLSISLRTVEDCRTKMIEKTNSKNFIAVVLMAVKHRYVKMDNLLSRKDLDA